MPTTVNVATLLGHQNPQVRLGALSYYQGAELPEDLFLSVLRCAAAETDEARIATEILAANRSRSCAGGKFREALYSPTDLSLRLGAARALSDGQLAQAHGRPLLSAPLTLWLTDTCQNAEFANAARNVFRQIPNAAAGALITVLENPEVVLEAAGQRSANDMGWQSLMIRARAASILGDIRAQTAVGSLRPLLQHADAWFGSVCAQALLSIGVNGELERTARSQLRTTPAPNVWRNIWQYS